MKLFLFFFLNNCFLKVLLQPKEGKFLTVVQTSYAHKDASHTVLDCLIDEMKASFSRGNYKIMEGINALDSSSYLSPD